MVSVFFSSGAPSSEPSTATCISCPWPLRVKLGVELVGFDFYRHRQQGKNNDQVFLFFVHVKVPSNDKLKETRSSSGDSQATDTAKKHDCVLQARASSSVRSYRLNGQHTYKSVFSIPLLCQC